MFARSHQAWVKKEEHLAMSPEFLKLFKTAPEKVRLSPKVQGVSEGAKTPGRSGSSAPTT